MLRSVVNVEKCDARKVKLKCKSRVQNLFLSIELLHFASFAVIDKPYFHNLACFIYFKFELAVRSVGVEEFCR